MESQSQDIGVWCKSLLCLKIGQRGFLCLQSWIKAFLQLGCAHSYPQKVWTRSLKSGLTVQHGFGESQVELADGKSGPK
jgi:hypothetical protein